MPLSPLTKVERQFFRAMLIPVLGIVLAWIIGYGSFSYLAKVDQIEQHVDAIARTYSVTMAQAIWDLDYERATALTETLLLSPEIATVRVEDDRGGLMAEATRPGDAQIIISSIDQPIVREDQFGNHVIGRLIIEAHGHAVLAGLIKNTAIGLGLLISSLIAIAIAVVAVNRRTILGPLQHLLEAIKKTGDGSSYQKVEIDREDEIADVIHAYDNLMHVLDQKEKALAAHRDNLEDMVRDRTLVIERQAAELEEALEQERRLSALQRNFVSMASHEFRTPLAIIDSNAQRMERRFRKMTEDDILTRTKKIRNAVNRMVSLMESTLDAAKMEAGTIEIKPVPTDVRSLLTECCEAQREIAAKHEIVVDDKGLPDQIIADPKALIQVFSNLLSNAVKYSPDADRIEIRTWQDASDVFISVRDYGLGMDEDDLQSLFSRYFRAKTSVGIAGTGIGLNLVKMLVEGHEGQITVTSLQGEGSEFIVRLPKAGPDSIEKTAA